VSVRDLPALNAILNGTAALLLVIAFVLIRRGRREAHKRIMIAAFCTCISRSSARTRCLRPRFLFWQ
jgi:uncharacterized membrane protein YozB (DUF420 family)